MTPLLRTGVTIVVLALASYTVGVVIEQRARRVTGRALAFLVTGVVFDVTATVCMILGSGKVLTLHGVLGYSALAGMLVETVFAARHRLRAGDAAVPRWLHLSTRVAYSWWVIAFVSGGILVATSR
ncbi:MAG: hypothetical protein ACHQQS_10270 [Thermoanaerobaculales bacterium]